MAADMASEMMDDAIDDALDDEETEEETADLVGQVGLCLKAVDSFCKHLLH